MLNRIGIALGAGLAAALLISVMVKGTAAALALAYLAPLPVMIAALGWGADAGAMSSLIAAAVVAVVLDPPSGLSFLLTVALPAAFLAHVAVATSWNPFRQTPPAPQSKRLGLGAIVTTAAILGAIVSVGAMATMILLNGGYEKAVASLREALEPAIADAMGGDLGLPEDFGPADLAQLVIKYAPSAVSASTTLILVINLYLAARVTQLSQRLPRPWLDIPTQLRLPPSAALVGLALVAASALLPEPYNSFVGAVAAPLALIFVFQGLAVLHAMSRPRTGRTRLSPALYAVLRAALIFSLYLALVIAPRWVGLALAIIGGIESFASLRARQAAKPFRK